MSAPLLGHEDMVSQHDQTAMPFDIMLVFPQGPLVCDVIKITPIWVFPYGQFVLTVRNIDHHGKGGHCITRAIGRQGYGK